MKFLRFIPLLLSFNFILNLKLPAQSPIHFENEPHIHKKDLHDDLALKKFNYDTFIRDINASFSLKGYSYTTDKCLQDFFVPYQINLLSEIFKAYSEDKSAATFNSIFNSNSLKYKTALNLFIQNENSLRAEYQRKIRSGLSLTNSTSAARGGSDPTTQAGCTNMDFESGNLNGWVVTSSAGKVPFITVPGNDALIPTLSTTYSIGVIPPASPYVGQSVCLDAIAGGNAEWLQMSQNFTVSNANANFLFYVALVMSPSGGHACGQNPKFTVSVTNSNNFTIPCSGISLEGASAQGNANPCTPYTGWTTVNNVDFLDWTPVMVPLQAYIGQNVTISMRVTRCAGGGGHGVRAYLESTCDPKGIIGTDNVICPGKPVKLYAPEISGFNYNWTSSSGFTANTPSISPTQAGSYSVTITNPSTGCSINLDTTLTSVASPTANFNFTVTPCTVTNTVPVLSTSTAAPADPISTYSWIWGDATTNGSGISDTHTYLAAGTKTVELKVTSASGCRDSIQKTMTFVPKPIANFSFVNNCVNVSSTFTSTSISGVPLVAQIWNFGDGSAAGMGATPNHTYTTPGTYAVKLVVTNALLCKDSITQNITIYPEPAVIFTANPVCFGTAVTFTNTSAITGTSTITNWDWDFNNDAIMDNTTMSPTYNYAATGVYTVSLKATSNNSCAKTGTTTVTVNALPTATFTPADACVGATILLNNTSSVPLPDVINAYTWAFGAGSTPISSSNQNPPALSYSSSGTKTITLNITANTTCTASITKTVMVNAIPTPSFSTSSVCQGLQTVFTDLSTTGNGTINNWQWDYTTDGAPDNATQNPGFIYPASGTFTTSLQVTTSTGCTNTFTLPVNVWGHSIPNFSPDNVCYGTATTFTNLTNTTTNANTGGIPTYDWAFADGSSNSAVINPAHTYSLGANGNAVYNVTLTATTTHTCTDFITKTVNVFAVPTASFTSDSVCLGTPSHMLDASNGNGNIVNMYNWDFLSNGTVDAAGVSNPNYIFPSFGTNLVSYTISTTPVAGLTCSNITSTLTVYVNPNPVPDFTFVNKCINTQPNAFDASVSTVAVGTNTNYAWAYGDGATGNGSNVTHNYAASSAYNVTLTVTSTKGCVANIVKTVDVYQKPLMSIANSSACDKKAMTFTATPLPNSGVITDWFWDYNNSINTIEANGQAVVSTVFPAAGVQTVYLVTVSNPGQCRDTMFKQIYVDYVPKPLFSVDKPSGCPEHCVKFTDNTLPVTGPAVNANWKWILGDGTIVNAGSNISQDHCYQNGTSNQVNLFDIKLVVTTDKGCVDSLEKTSFITVYPTPIANYAINPSEVNIVTPLTYFVNESVDYTKWWWSFGDGAFNSDSVNVNPTHFYNDATASTYHTGLLVMNQYGCIDRAYVPIEITPEFIFYIPNAFTPANGDNVNDLFTGNGIGIEKYDMWIYDRWGEMIYYSNDIAKGWNGKKTGKSEEVQQDVYIWKVKIRDILGKNHDYVGHVTLVK